MQAVILSIGDELILGQTLDTNSAYLAAKLAELGIATLYHQTLPDDPQLIADAITQATQHAQYVLITGGLGPTKDDLTRQALADTMGVELREDPKSLSHITTYFADRGMTMSDTNRVQAQFPVGTTTIENTRGTAPGIKATLNNAQIFVMPGVPHEMRAMYDAAVLPALTQHAATRKTILTTKVNTFGMGESAVGQRLDDLMTRNQNPTVGTTVSNGIVSIRIRSESNDPNDARDRLEQVAQQVEQRLGPITFGRDDQTLASTFVTLLKNSKLTVATAESCTGGLISKLITDAPGSSQIYLGGWVTYTNELKHTQLAVPEALLQQHGAVSGPVVCAMAAGALKHSGADLAVSVSGVAGPAGGTDDKPVGTVWLGLASNNTSGANPTAIQLRLPGDRQSIRNRAALSALQWLRLHLADHPPSKMTWVVDTHCES
jgi:competence/damage-inducible protein CinA-like protein